VPSSSRRIAFGLLVALAAITSSATTLGNQFTQDDVALVVEDERVRDPARWDEYLNEAYWPAPLQRDLYRPLTSLLIAAEWHAGGGEPVSFKILQVALYAASAVAVLALLLRLFPPAPALAGGLLFAIHPVHVEAVALAVTQAEVLVGLLATLAVAWYYDRRRRGWLTMRDHAGLAGITLMAAHVKESGIMLPALLFAVEVFLIAEPRWRERWRRLSPLFTWQTLAVTLVLFLRSRIPFETASGSFVAEAFEGMPIWGRFLTMLSIVPEWLRLLLWPATLSADYAPRTIMPATTWGLDQTIGATILVLVGFLAWRVRHRLPAFSFGVGWCAIGIFPVSNVLLPTGIPLAERTLFLPSIGVMISVAAALGALPAVFPARRLLVARTLAVLVALTAILGTRRSMARHRIWHDMASMWTQTVVDVPDSYRARMALGTLLMKAGYPDRAIVFYQRAIELWDKAWGPQYQLAEWYRQRAECEPAIGLYQAVLTDRDIPSARSGLIACLLFTGDYEQGRAQALEGIRHGYDAALFRVWFHTADSAVTTRPAPGTVRFPAGHDYLFADDSVAQTAAPAR
jgi:hypothetical protein